MKKYYKIKLTILEENEETNYNSLKTIKEEIIVKQTLTGNFKEIVTGLVFGQEYDLSGGQVRTMSKEKIISDYASNKDNYRNHKIKTLGFYLLVENDYFKYDNPIAKYNDIWMYIEHFDELNVSKYLKKITYEKEEQSKIKRLLKNRNIK